MTHSHSHSDHFAGDNQFKGKKHVTLIEPNTHSVEAFYRFERSTDEEVELSLGARDLIIFKIPGHQTDSIAVYDPHTQWLLTGDTFYPGRLYIKHWNKFKQSINKLAEFSRRFKVSAYLGTHIEMSMVSGQDYEMGSTFQPNETSLVLTHEDLLQLKSTLELLGDKPKRIVLDKVIIYPIK